MDCVACQASLSITNAWSMLKLMSIELVMPSNHLILCHHTLMLWAVFFFTNIFSSVAQSCPNLGNPMDCSMPNFPVPHQLLELAQTHVHQVGDAIQPSHPLTSPSPPTFNPSQHQGLFQGVSSSHQVAKGLEFQLQHQSFQ